MAMDDSGKLARLSWQRLVLEALGGISLEVFLCDTSCFSVGFDRWCTLDMRQAGGSVAAGFQAKQVMADGFVARSAQVVTSPSLPK